MSLVNKDMKVVNSVLKSAYSAVPHNVSISGNKLLNAHVEIENSIKTLFHKFIDEFDIDTTNIDVEQFFKENL